MEHPAATEEVIRLIPSMAGNNPSDVLLKRAKEKRWAPAQLHKVAQVYNTCSTLHAQQVDRNSLPELVDAPALIDRYVNETGRSANKAASSFMHDNPEQTSTPLDKVASFEAVDRDPEVPFVWSEKPVEKVAVSQERGPDPYVERAQIMESFVANAKRVIKSANQISYAGGDYNKSLKKCASSIRDENLRQGRDNILIDLERDARSTRETPLVENAFQLFEGFAKSAGIPCNRFDPNKHEDRIIGKDSTGLLSLVDDIHGSYVKYASAVTVFSEELESLLDKIPGVPEDGDKKAGQWMDRVKEASYEVSSLLKLASAAREREEARSDSPTKKRVISQSSLKGTIEDLVDSEGSVGYIADADFEDAGAARANTDAARALLGMPAQITGAIGNKTRDVVAPQVRILKGLASPDGDLANFVAPAGERSTRRGEDLQRDLNDNGRDIESRMHLKELITTDEILSEADPVKVVEAYNDIRNASTEIAGSKSMLRLQLRQAIQHQGYDVDSATAARKFERGNAEGKNS